MPFDPLQFAAQASLGLIPSEDFPSAAQDALIAGYDGRWVVRMAILEKPSGWEVDQVLPKMLEELKVELPEPRVAAIYLAKVRVERIQQTGEDPLKSMDYFYGLLDRAGYPDELQELGFLDDHYTWTDEAGVRSAVIEAMESLMDPELAARRRTERVAACEEIRRQAPLEWPYVFDSPSGKKLFRQRWKDRMLELRPILGITLVGCAMMGWDSGFWKFSLICAVGMFPFGIAASALGVYRQMKAECQDYRWRHGLDQ
jgi:hypothetical protein